MHFFIVDQRWFEGSISERQIQLYADGYKLNKIITLAHMLCGNIPISEGEVKVIRDRVPAYKFKGLDHGGKLLRIMQFGQFLKSLLKERWIGIIPQDVVQGISDYAFTHPRKITDKSDMLTAQKQHIKWAEGDNNILANNQFRAIIQKLDNGQGPDYPLVVPWPSLWLWYHAKYLDITADSEPVTKIYAMDTVIDYSLWQWGTADYPLVGEWEVVNKFKNRPPGIGLANLQEAIQYIQAVDTDWFIASQKDGKLSRVWSKITEEY